MTASDSRRQDQHLVVLCMHDYHLPSSSNKTLLIVHTVAKTSYANGTALNRQQVGYVQ